MKTVGIVGGTGYMGGEALRILLEHPGFEVRWITSRGDVTVESVHRNLVGVRVPVIRPEDITPCDAYVLALPSGSAMDLAPTLLADGVVVDLGSDFRLKDRSDWERVYGRTHTNWDLVDRAVYGIAELHRDEIRAARLVANPGCFSSAVILGLAPLARAGELTRSSVTVTGMSGTAGVGAELSVAAHHPEIGNNVVLYNVVDHRHTYEMEQELGACSGSPVTVHFTPSYIPITRGIVAVCSVAPFRGESLDRVRDLYLDFYGEEPFVHVVPFEAEENASWQWRPYPTVSAVSGTNHCHIGFDIDRTRDRLVVFSVLDNMGKGGAHAGVQNLNLMLGLDESAGLTRRGMHPY